MTTLKAEHSTALALSANSVPLGVNPRFTKREKDALIENFKHEISQHIARLQDSHRQALVSGRAKIQKRINRIPRRYWSKTIQELTDDLEAPRDLPQLTYPTSSLKTIKEDKSSSTRPLTRSNAIGTANIRPKSVASPRPASTSPSRPTASYARPTKSSLLFNSPFKVPSSLLSSPSKPPRSSSSGPASSPKPERFLPNNTLQDQGAHIPTSSVSSPVRTFKSKPQTAGSVTRPFSTIKTQPNAYTKSTTTTLEPPKLRRARNTPSTSDFPSLRTRSSSRPGTSEAILDTSSESSISSLSSKSKRTLKRATSSSSLVSSSGSPKPLTNTTKLKRGGGVSKDAAAPRRVGRPRKNPATSSGASSRENSAEPRPARNLRSRG